jgi:hypothetical protein
MFLTSPLIDQAVTLKTPRQGMMGVMGIFRQVTARSSESLCSGSGFQQNVELLSFTRAQSQHGTGRA